MDVIHDRATKLFKDARKKHIPAGKVRHGENKKEPAKQLTPITCCYCLKVFFNSSFVLKHILRRHAGEFVALHQKCLQQETSDDSLDTKYILDVMQAEFAALRKELSSRETTKQNMHLTPVKHKELSVENASEVLQNLSDINVSQEHFKNCEIDAPDDNIDSNSKAKNLPSNEICSDLASVKNTSINNAKELSVENAFDVQNESNINDSIEHLKNYEIDAPDINIDSNSTPEILPSNEICSALASVTSTPISKSKEISLDVEKELKYMHRQFNRLNNLIENEILLKDDVNNLMTITENKILKLEEEKFLQLHDYLQKDLQNMLSSKISETSLEWKLQFTELKKEIENLTFVVDLIRQKVHSDEHLKAFEKRFEAEIIKFLGNNSHRDNHLKRNLTLRKVPSFENKSISPDKPAVSIRNNRTFSNSSTSYVQNCVSDNSQEKNSGTNLNAHDLSAVLAAKMLSLGIVPCASKVSSEDYLEKMKEIENAKKLLGKHNQSFFDIYEQINNYAEQTANAKLKKKTKKIRFSEYEPHIKNFHKRNKKFKSKLSETYPFMESGEQEASELTLASKKNPTVASRKKLHNKTHPILKTDNTALSEISLNETVHQDTQQGQVDNYPVNESFGFGNSAFDGGDGDYFESLLKPESRKQLQSTPLKKNKPLIIRDEISETVMPMCQVEMNSVNPTKHSIENLKDISEVPTLKDVKATYLFDNKNYSTSNIVMRMSKVEMNSVNPTKSVIENIKDISQTPTLKDMNATYLPNDKNDYMKATYLPNNKNDSCITNCSIESNSCSSSSKTRMHKVSDDFPHDSNTGSLFHKNTKNVKGSFIPDSVKHHFDKISLSDVSSLESLSSWEGDDND